MLYTKAKMAELIAGHTGQTIEQIEADSDRDRWFTAEEAKEYGMVDLVAASAGQVAGDGGTGVSDMTFPIHGAPSRRDREETEPR
jgi:ATP-dependent Clp protease protease subunit